ncbi:annexin [Caldimonas brevitalea]|uniref:Flagellar hook-length control protein FliK n=1 Tax=Caldimonas brevitalea TaxID=413882 RepID=A0A0G3BIX9_9BURK|nr:annexin [Caldimonas brevitalea]AKJ27316.1 flagellar hook-length control protein FliK [Caldimonas brevitalea]
MIISGHGSPQLPSDLPTWRPPQQPQRQPGTTQPNTGGPPRYTEQQATADAKALWEATKGGLTGWGTDEGVVWNTLKGKSATDLETLKRTFKQNYRHDLEQVLDDEFDGVDEDHARALMRGSEHRSGSDAVEVEAELEGIFGDDQEILKLLESRTAPERGQVAVAYAARHGGPKDEPGARAFLLERLKTEGGFSTDEMARARGLLLPEGGDVAAGEARAGAAKVKVAVDGWGVDEQTLKDLFAGKTPEQIKAIESAYEQAYGHELRDRLHDELEGSDQQLVFHLLDPAQGGDPAAKSLWQTRQDALRLHAAVDGAGTDEGALRRVLEGKTPTELRAIETAYRQEYGIDLRQRLKEDLSGTEGDEILHLLEARDPQDPGAAEWQARHDALRLRDAVDGAGTDEDTLRAILGGRSKSQIDAIAQAYREEYGDDLRGDLTDDLDGRDEFELVGQLYDRGAIDFESDPRAAIAEQIRRGREMQAYEKDDKPGFWGTAGRVLAPPLLLADVTGTDPIDVGQQVLHGDLDFETDSARLDRTLDEAERALQAGDLPTAARYAGFSEQNVRSLIETKNSASEAAATGAAVVAATAVTIGTAGTASPLMVAVMAGAAGGMSSGVTYGTLNSQAGGTEIARQVTINTVSGATGAVPLGRGGVVLSMADDSAAQASRQGALRGLRETATDGAWVGGQNGAADGVVRTSTDSSTWQHGIDKGLQQVALNGLIGGGGGALTGGVTGALLSPVVRLRAPAARPGGEQPTVHTDGAVPPGTGRPVSARTGGPADRDGQPVPLSDEVPASPSGPAARDAGGDVQVSPVRQGPVVSVSTEPSPAYLTQVGLPPTQGDSGGVVAMVKKFANRDGLREFASAVSSTPRVKRHNTSAWITGRLNPGDYARLQVPIRSIRSQHSVDGAAAEKTAQRAASIQRWLEEHPQATTLDMRTLDELAGSTGSIQVGWHSGDRFITLDGVGRVEAVRTALRGYEAQHGAAHPLNSVETYATRLTDDEYAQLYKTSTYFRNEAGDQLDRPQHDLVPFTAVPRFVAGTGMNLVKQLTTPVMHRLPIGPVAPDRRLPADLLRLTDEGGPAAPGTPLRQAGGPRPQREWPRDDELGPRISMQELLARPLRPGREGVILTDDEIRLGDVYTLSSETGVEYALAIERVEGREVFKLYSGDAWSSGVPQTGTHIGHTHPNEVDGQQFPSRADMRSATNMVDRLRTYDDGVEPPEQFIIWGSGDHDYTVYYGGAYKVDD